MGVTADKSGFNALFKLFLHYSRSRLKRCMICKQEEQKKLKANRSGGIDVKLMVSDTLVLNFYREAYTK